MAGAGAGHATPGALAAASMGGDARPRLRPPTTPSAPPPPSPSPSACCEAAIAGTSRRRAAPRRRLGRLLADAAGRALLFALTDEVLRTPPPAGRCASCATSSPAGCPAPLPRLDRLGLRLAATALARSRPGPVAAIVRQRIRAETRGVIVPAGDPAFARYVRRRRADGFDLNVNLLGEAILGDDEAAARLDAVVRPASAAPTSTTSR